MNQVYVIRDTLPKEMNHVVEHLRKCIQNQFDSIVVKIINSQDQMQVFDHLCGNIVNLDPFTRKSEHHVLDVCRVFDDDQSKSIGFTNREYSLSLENQCKLLPYGGITVVDDDIATGSTINFITELLAKHRPDINIVKTVSLLHETISDEIYDVIDAHDFINIFQTSGLYVLKDDTITRCLYDSEFVNLSYRAKLPNPAKFLREWKQK